MKLKDARGLTVKEGDTVFWMRPGITAKVLQAGEARVSVPGRKDMPVLRIEIALPFEPKGSDTILQEFLKVPAGDSDELIEMMSQSMADRRM